jgi:hypothetical protein
MEDLASCTSGVSSTVSRRLEEAFERKRGISGKRVRELLREEKDFYSLVAVRRERETISECAA